MNNTQRIDALARMIAHDDDILTDVRECDVDDLSSRYDISLNDAMLLSMLIDDIANS